MKQSCTSPLRGDHLDDPARGLLHPLDTVPGAAPIPSKTPNQAKCSLFRQTGIVHGADIHSLQETPSDSFRDLSLFIPVSRSPSW